MNEEPCLRRGLWLLEQYDTPERLLKLWKMAGSWHTTDTPEVEKAFPWYRVAF